MLQVVLPDELPSTEMLQLVSHPCTHCSGSPLIILPCSFIIEQPHTSQDVFLSSLMRFKQ